MSRLVEHINNAAPEVDDLTVDQPSTHRWLPTSVAPVLGFPVLVGLAIMYATYATSDGAGCIIEC